MFNNKVNLEEKQKASLIYLWISLFIFLGIIFSILYFIVKSGIFYIPVLSDKYYEEMQINENIPKDPVNIYQLFQKITYDKDANWHIILTEANLNYFLEQYFLDSWQVVVNEDEMVLSGPLFSALNKEDQKVYCKLIYNVQEDKTEFYMANFHINRTIADYFINKYFLDNQEKEEKSADNPYFQQIIFKDAVVEIVGNPSNLQELRNNIDYDKLKNIIIDYLLK